MPCDTVRGSLDCYGKRFCSGSVPAVQTTERHCRMDILREIKEITQAARKSAGILAAIPSDIKNRALAAMAEQILTHKEYLFEENRKDCDRARENGISQAMLDRLTLTDSVINTMAQGIQDVIALPDPVGTVTSMWKRPNGLLVGRQRIPLGVIGIIYESRPNVTADAAALCLKSGNAVILRGGSEAINSNLAIASLLRAAIGENGLPETVVQVIPTTDREAVTALLSMEDDVDLIIPRGGEDLIRMVVETSRIPVIKHYKGVCHIFVDDSADIDMAVDICLNAKTQKPSVCNAMETLLIHHDIAGTFLPFIAEAMTDRGVTLRGCDRSRKILPSLDAADETDWETEYLDLILAVRIVDGIDEAMDHITKYGSLHTESIVTTDYANAQRFLREVNSSTVLVNASTRFSDGFELGLGAEIGISTTKLHAFGPMGLEELTTTKFIIYGNGQIRT